MARGITYINTVLDGTTTSVQGGPIPLGLLKPRSWSFSNHWNQLAADGQTLDASLTWEITNDPRAWTDIIKASNTADWHSLTGATTPSLTFTDPATGAGDDLVNGSFSGWSYIRLAAARNSGSGRFTSYFDYIDG